MALNEVDLELVQRLVDRLERLSADSTYAHQASGLRGTLLRYLDRIEDESEVNTDELNRLVHYGFEILKDAAKELGVSK